MMMKSDHIYDSRVFLSFVFSAAKKTASETHGAIESSSCLLHILFPLLVIFKKSAALGIINKFLVVFFFTCDYKV